MMVWFLNMNSHRHPGDLFFPPSPSIHVIAGWSRMGGYASTPRKAKTSEEGTDETLCYAASGMQVIS